MFWRVDLILIFNYSILSKDFKKRKPFYRLVCTYLKIMMNHKKLLKPTQLNYICTEIAYFMVIVFIRYVSVYAEDIL